ncbi:receptor-like protein 9DC3 [Rhodamnia argentea]|uniref:Receptor-like protein 9DC3 n=1 Tax=Rhodamnia argentea TaxID=178133 RepID=A0ABM3GXB2_9MYRT|nr:receptor-like protein 9DC3 [Rhodamnia argentea]
MEFYQTLCLLVSLSAQALLDFPFTTAQSCHPVQSNALLQFSNSLTVQTDMYPHCDPKTTRWENGLDCCLWDGVACDNVTGNVIGLDLSFSCLQGTLHSDSSLFALRHLQSLNLGANNFLTSPILPELSVFTELRHLNLTYSNFSGLVPTEISYLSKLVLLDLSQTFNGTTTYVPSGLRIENTDFKVLVQNLTELRVLKLDLVDMSAVSPSSFVNLSSSLTVFSASSCNLQGELPPNIFRLPNLLDLDLQSNDIMVSFPKSNWSKSVESLTLSYTNISGKIPDSISELKNLKTLALRSCILIGSIPSSLVNLTELTRLDLWHNELTGHPPSFVGKLERLIHLDLSYNNFIGVLDFSVFSTLKNLQVLRLTVGLNLDSNNMNYIFSELEILELSSCNLIEFPSFLKSSRKLRKLDLSKNKISGRIPRWFWDLGKDTLSSLDISSNLIEGDIPQFPWKELFDGHLAECLMALARLSVLNLRMNMIQGVIPGKIARDSSLRTLDFSQNRFEGTLPRSLLQCKSLEVLDLSNNTMEDTFPDWLETLPKLQVLVLRSNKFHGFVRSPRAARPFPELRIFDLSNNNFSGPLPIRYIMKLTAMMNREKGRGQLQYMGGYGYQDSVMVTMKGLEIRLVKILTIFTSIDLSSNHFVGGLPMDIGSLKSLKGLNISHNNLTGYIPPSTGNLTDLESLDLSSNRFTGRIPQELADLTSLAFLNLSENRLIGPIPPGPQFTTFKSDSFAGNLGLCGFPLPETCKSGSWETPP